MPIINFIDQLILDTGNYDKGLNPGVAVVQHKQNWQTDL